MLSEWDKNDTGNVSLTPLVSLEAVVIFGVAVGLRLELSTNEDRPLEDLRAVQTGMTPDQAHDIIERLQWCLDNLDAPPETTN